MNLIPNEYDHIFLDGRTIDQLRPPAGPLNKIPVMCNTTIQRLLESGKIPEAERNRLEELTGRARGRLYAEMKWFDETLETQWREYLRKAQVFLEGVERLHRERYEQAEIHRKGKVLYTDTVGRWLFTAGAITTEGRHLLFARFCGLEQVFMMQMKIHSRKMRKHPMEG